MKTSESYLPEGSYMVQPAVRQAFSTLGALRQAQDEGRILEAVAQRCTAAHDLLFDLGIAQGILPRVSCALGVAEGDTDRFSMPMSDGTPQPASTNAPNGSRCVTRAGITSPGRRESSSRSCAFC